MILKGKILSVSKDWATGQIVLSLALESVDEALNNLRDKLLSIDLKPFVGHRSVDANKMLWACIGEIASAIKSDKWSVYLFLLKRYGVYTYMTVLKRDLERIQKQWRETEIVGDDGYEVELLCYFGSSSYTTAEFSRLLEGTISEMKEMGLETPPSEEMKRSLEQWEKKSKA